MKVNPKKDNATIKMTKGVFAIREVLGDILKNNRRIFAYGIPKEAPGRFGPILRDFHKERIKKKILMMHIYNSDAKDRVKLLDKMEYTEARVLPQKYNSATTTIINGNDIYMIFWNDEITLV